MDKYQIMGILILAGLAAIYGVSTKLYQMIRGDAGFNIGRNHMHELGFDDDDIHRGQDDADADLYFFRKPQQRNQCQEEDSDDEISEEDEYELYHYGKIGSKHMKL